MINFRFSRGYALRFSNLVFLSLLGELGFSNPVAASDFRLVPGKSRVEFRISHLALGTVHGSFERVTGSFQLNPSGNVLRKLESTVDPKSVNTGIGTRDDQLQGEGFLRTDRFPDMTFAAKKCDSTDNGTTVMGILTLGGSARPMTFFAGIPEMRRDSMGKKQVVITGKTDFQRKGMSLTFSDLRDRDEKWLGDKVQVEVFLVGEEF